MRTHGKLIKWNDDRGFGFVAVAQGNEEVFVHVSAFPPDGQRPQVGEVISFELQAGADGKRKAMRVQRPGGHSTRREVRRESKSAAGGWVGKVASIGALLAITAFVYTRWAPPETATDIALPAASSAQPLAAGETFTCDGRTHCSEMRSCAEAEYFIEYCPGTKMDGNNDGEPCEQQLCK